MIQITNLRKSYQGVDAVKIDQLEFNPGEVIGLVGNNGAGKTTASFTILPDILDCREFVNADEIAKGLSPFQPETVALQSGRLMLERIDQLLKANLDFAFETTLASRSYVNTVKVAKELG